MAEFKRKEGPVEAVEVTKKVADNPNEPQTPVVSVKEVPSQGLIYPEGFTVSYRTYRYGEIKNYGRSKLSFRQEIDLILSGITTSIDPLNLTYMDFLYLGFSRRISSLGTPEMAVTYECDSCKSKQTFTCEEKELEFQDLTMSSLPVGVELRNTSLEFSPITLRGYLELEKIQRNDDEVALMAKQCVNLEYSEAYKIIDNLSPDEGDLINQIDEMLYHGLKPLDIKCTSCQAMNEVEVDGGATSIKPFRRAEGSAEHKFYFGSKTVPIGK